MKLKYLKNAIICGAYALLLTPLIVSSSTLYPYIVGKALFFRLIVEAMLGLYLILLLFDRRYSPRLNWLSGLVYGFILVVLVSSLAGVDLQNSFWSNQERMEGVVTALHLGALFLILTSILRTKKEWFTFLKSAVAVAAFVGFYAIVQDLRAPASYRRSHPRLAGTFGNPTFMGSYLVFPVFLSFYFFLKEKVAWQKYLMGFLLLFNIAVMLFTATRGVIVGTFFGALAVALVYGIFTKNLQAKR